MSLYADRHTHHWLSAHFNDPCPLREQNRSIHQILLTDMLLRIIYTIYWYVMTYNLFLYLYCLLFACVTVLSHHLFLWYILSIKRPSVRNSSNGALKEIQCCVFSWETWCSDSPWRDENMGTKGTCTLQYVPWEIMCSGAALMQHLSVTLNFIHCITCFDLITRLINLDFCFHWWSSIRWCSSHQRRVRYPLFSSYIGTLL